MMLRFWLRRNFLRRGLRWLRERVAKQLFGGLLLPSLLPRFPAITPTNDATLVRDGRELWIGSSDPVSLESNYVDWLAQLTQLPGESPAPLHFPANEYLDSLKRSNALDVDFFHRCRASRFDGAEPSVILIYNRRSSATDCQEIRTCLTKKTSAGSSNSFNLKSNKP